jgi:hypothetical protein
LGPGAASGWIQIARQPFQNGDFLMIDAAGRMVDNLLLEDYLFSF